MTAATWSVSTAAPARRLRNDPDLADGLVRFRAATVGSVQSQDFLLLEHVPIWIGSVNHNKAAPDVQEQLGYLDRFDTALSRLADQQRSLEQSMRQGHDLSQRELRQLAARVKALEERIGGAITREQRGYIYQMVHHWAAARVQHEQRSYNEAISSCWAALKARYKLAKYEQLPATLYDDCVQYIEGQYQRLTGSPLNLPEQRGLGLED